MIGGNGNTRSLRACKVRDLYYILYSGGKGLSLSLVSSLVNRVFSPMGIFLNWQNINRYQLTKYPEVQLRLNIGKFPYLCFWASNASSLPKIGQFLIATYIKQKSPYKTS